MQLIPKVLESRGSSNTFSTSITYDEALRKSLQDLNNRETFIKTVGCNFEYVIFEEGYSCPHVNILLKFFSESELKKFEKIYESEQLVSRLEKFFSSAGHLELGNDGNTLGEDFKLEVSIDQKYFKQKATSTQEHSWYVQIQICLAIGIHNQFFQTSSKFYTFLNVYFCAAKWRHIFIT